ncbi:MAG: mechanosensitive ion channel, partial [Rhodospirillales bacterium]
AVIALAAVAALVLLLVRSVRQSRSEGRIRKTLRERRLSRRVGWKRLVGPSEVAGIAMTLAFPALFIAGYRDVADWLLIGLVGSVMGLAVLAFMTSTFETTASHLVRRWLRPGIALRLGNRVPARTERHLQFWVSTVMTLFAFLFIAGLIILAWGVEPSQIWLWFDGRMEGIEFGEFELHFISIFYALLALLAVLAISRGLQGMLERRLFDNIDLPLSARSGIKSLIGYSGFVIGILVFLMTLGIDLGNLALVAGALSVGLGFGIQAIVVNFVSGILLLLERPIKVGDWVRIGEFEGKVRRISFRATELETAERASVLVPNSSIISGAVLNRSFKDKLGRVELEIRTAANRPVSELREALLACAQDVREFVALPSPKVILSDADTGTLIFRVWAFMPFIDVADKRLAEGELRERIHDCLRNMD